MYLQCIDRATKEITTKVHHPASIQSVLQIYPIAYFDMDLLPYVFIRDKLNLTFYDIKNNKAYWLMKERQCDTTLYQMGHMFDEDNNKFLVDLVIYSGSSSRVARFEFGLF